MICVCVCANNFCVQRKLKGNWKISSNREDSALTIDLLSSSRVFVLAGPREKFTENEINSLKKYLEVGGSLLVLLGKKKKEKKPFLFICMYSGLGQFFISCCILDFLQEFT